MTGVQTCALPIWTGLAATFGMFECDLEFVGPAELIDAAHHLAARYTAAAS